MIFINLTNVILEPQSNIEIIYHQPQIGRILTSLRSLKKGKEG